MRSPRPNSNYTVQALARGLAVLDAFAGPSPKLGVSDVATIAGLPKPTAFRLLATLEQAGYVERLPDGFFRPSYRVLRLGEAALRGSDLVEISAGILRHLAETTGLSVNLGVLSGANVLYLVRQRGSALVSANLQAGSILPAVYSSLGKAMLADLSDAELANQLGDWDFSQAPTSKSVKSMRALKKQLRAARENGFSVQDEEVARGLRAVAAPIRSSNGRAVAAVNVATTAGEIPLSTLVSDYHDTLLNVAQDLSTRLGYASSSQSAPPGWTSRV